jgi:hypothetical protein
MDIETLRSQMEEYKKEWQKTAENRDKMVQMANQQERKLEQLAGAISALERLLVENSKEMEEENTQEVLSDEQVNDIPESAKG